MISHSGMTGKITFTFCLYDFLNTKLLKVYNIVLCLPVFRSIREKY